MYSQKSRGPNVKVQEAEEGELGESTEDRDETDYDEDVQSGRIRHLIKMIIMMILNAVVTINVTWGLVLPPKPMVTTAKVLVAPSPVLAAVS